MSYVDHPEESPVIISICTGTGGLEKGLALALGCEPEVTAYVETEAFICENLLVAMEAGVLAPTPIWTDLRTFDWAPFRGNVHGLVGGYPCQGFSLAGNRKGQDDPRYLWPFIREGIRAAEFVWTFFENVDDHITMGYDVVYKDLRSMGYLVEAGIYSSEEAGAPHERQRLYIFAIRQEMAYTNGYDPGRIINNVLRQERKGPAKKDQWQRDWNEPGSRGEAVADAGSFGVHQSGSDEQSEQFEQDGLQGGDELGNAKSNDERNVWSGRKGRESTGESGIELENTGSQRARGGSKRSSGGQTRKGDAQGSGGEVEHTPGLGREGQPNERRSDNSPDEPERRGIEWDIGRHTAFRGWPAGQGDYQYPYEAPRVVESGLFYNVDGYGFMGDLHRAIGNSVSPQVAQIAFIDLIHKHIRTANHGKDRNRS